MSQDITLNPPQQDAMVSSLERMARDITVPTDRIVTLFELAQRREQTLLRRAFFYDMNLMQQELLQVQKDKPNPAFHSKYATEEAVDRAARPTYTKCGFAITYGTAPPTVPGNCMVVCTVSHRSGYHEQHALEAPVVVGRGQTGVQAVGATVTYLKRTLVRMVLNLVTADNPEDDDGNGKDKEKGNGSRDAVTDWVDRFQMAADALTDSDGAKELMERPTVVAQLNMPPSPQRVRFMLIRKEIEDRWLNPMQTTSTAPPGGEEIEGL